MGNYRHMTQKYHPHTYRAALSIAAAATTFFASHAGAQMLGANIFAGTNGTNPTSISTTNATVSTGQSNTGPVGPGFVGTVSLGAGAANTLIETVNANNSGTLTAQETSPLPVGVGVGLLGNFSATKAIAVDFVPNQSYSFTLSTTTNSALNLLSGFNVAFTTVDGGTTTTVYSASGGVGLLSIVQVANLFGTGNTATFNFTAPANVDATVPITITVSGALAASALGSTFTFTNGTLNAVPEPGTVGAMAVGIAALATLRFRHRLARH